MYIPDLHIDATWTLFLDRDGVINRRLIDDYVKAVAEFEFLPGVPEALAILADLFTRIFIVTNQRGIARGLMSHDDLARVHAFLLKGVDASQGRIDKIYYCPHNERECNCRKPKNGLALQAKADFPEIDFDKAIMVGDSPSDIEMGKSLNMKTVMIQEAPQEAGDSYDFAYPSLKAFADALASYKGKFAKPKSN